MKVLNRVRVPESARTSQLLQTQDTTQNRVPTPIPWALSHPRQWNVRKQKVPELQTSLRYPAPPHIPEDSPVKKYDAGERHSCQSLPLPTCDPQPANQSGVTAHHQEEQRALRNQLAPGIINTKAGDPHPREATSPGSPHSRRPTSQGSYIPQEVHIP